MSLLNTKKTETNTAVLEISIDSETFNNAVTAVYNKKKATIQLPGFRKGKAPRHLIEQYYGSGIFYEDALNKVIPAAFEEALAESGLKIVASPEYEIKTIDKETGVVFEATVTLRPEVKIEGYKGIELTRKVEPVTDESIAAEVKKVQERNSRTTDVEDRPAQDGDTVNIDYEGFKDGVPFDGGKAEGYDLTLGSGQFIPGFEEKIVGHGIGEEFDIDLTFPEDYHAEELKGASVVFKIKLNGIKETMLPELDDEFAKDVSEFDTLDEYKADVKAKLEENAAKAADRDIDQQIVEKLVGLLEAEIPEVMFVQETENFVRDYDSRLRSQGLKLEDYLKYTGTTLDDMRARFRPQAEQQVKTRLALEKIAELESIEVSDEEIEEEYESLSKAYGMEVEQIKKYVAREDLAADKKVQKAVQFVKDNAVIKDE
mgnify:CR=1 FL=1